MVNGNVSKVIFVVLLMEFLNAAKVFKLVLQFRIAILKDTSASEIYYLIKLILITFKIP
jgi:hypothetical protein